MRPAGPGWARVRRASGLPPSPDSLPMSLLGWVLGIAAVYGALFATGAFIYGRPIAGTCCSLVADAGSARIARHRAAALWRPAAGPAPVKG